jgi:uncharacterized protein YaiE (UPF0345 family)
MTGTSNVEIRNITFYGPNIGIYATCPSVKLAYCTVTGKSSVGIYIQGATLFTLSTSTVIDTAVRGIVVENGSAHLVVNDSELKNNVIGIVIQTYDGAIVEVHRSNDYFNSEVGVLAMRRATLLFDAATVNTNVWDGVRIDGDTAAGTVMTATNSQFSKANRVGVHVIAGNVKLTMSGGDANNNKEQGVSFNYNANKPSSYFYANLVQFSQNTQNGINIGDQMFLSAVTVINCSLNQNLIRGFNTVDMRGTTSFYLANSVMSSNIGSAFVLNCNGADAENPTGMVEKTSFFDGSGNTQWLAYPRTSKLTIQNCLFVQGARLLAIEGGLIKSYNNTFVSTAGTSAEGISVIWSPSSGHEVKNCIISGPSIGMESYNGSSTFTNNYNLVNSATAYGTGIVAGANSLTGDPLFLAGSDGSQSNAYYCPRYTSPAINAGTNLSITDDLLGNTRPSPGATAPDIGAYEHQTNTPVELSGFVTE